MHLDHNKKIDPNLLYPDVLTTSAPVSAMQYGFRLLF